MRRAVLHWLAAAVAGATALLTLAASAALGGPATAPAARLDDEAFRRGLGDRGLVELLELHDREHPPRDDAARALRARVDALRTCDNAAAEPPARRKACEAATRILENLIATRPDDPDRFRWRYDIARDLTERTSRDAIDAMLFRVASATERQEVAATSARAIAAIDALARDLHAEWERIGALDPAEFERIAAANRLADLEAVEAASAYLLSWARLYRAMALPPTDASRGDLLRQVIDEVMTRRRWTALPHEKTGLQVQSLVLTGIAARLNNQFDLADTATQQAVGLYARMGDAAIRRPLDQWALLAVLERIRLLLDRGKADEARQAVDRAYAWASKARPDDLHTLVAIAVLDRLASPATAGKDPLLRIAREKARSRPLVYGTLGRSAADGADVEKAGEFERLSAAWVLLTEHGDAARAEALSQSVADAKDDFIAGEALFVLSQALSKQARPADAANALLRLVRSHPQSDRAGAALDEAIRLAAQSLATANAQGVETFVEIVRLLRQKSPGDRRLPELSFAAGVSLQRLQRWSEAADEFARVPHEYKRSAEAAVQRVRCLARRFEAEPGETTAKDALAAIDDALKALDRTSCGAGEVVCLKAGILASTAMQQFDAATTALADFDDTYAACQDLLGPMWVIRFRAAAASDRFDEAVRLAEPLMAAAPDAAGAAMAGLLARLQERASRTRDAGNDEALKAESAHVAALAKHLEKWSAGRATQNLPTLRLLRANALIEAGRADEAVALAEGEAKDSPDWQYVRAESFFVRRSYREALPLFNRVWQAAPDGSPLWWRALLRNLQCHAEVGTDPKDVLASIRQHRKKDAAMGGAATKRAFDALEQRLDKQVAK